MFQLKNSIVSFWAALVFIITLTLSLVYKNYELAVSGMLIIVILTAFTPGWRSTLFAGVLSMIFLTLLLIYFRDNETNLIKALFSQVYSLFITVFAVVIVFYLKRQQQSFAQTHMASLFENATEGILLSDQNGIIILVNPAAEKMFGYNADELIGSLVEKLIPGRFHGRHRSLREGYYANSSNRTMGTGRDLFARRKDNSEFPVEVSLSHYTQREEKFVIGFIVDITERKEIEGNLLRQKQELEKISNDIRKLNADLEGKVERKNADFKRSTATFRVTTGVK